MPTGSGKDLYCVDAARRIFGQAIGEHMDGTPAQEANEESNRWSRLGNLAG